MNTKPDPMRVISLTSIPKRFGGLGPTLESLLAQGADEVRLYVPATYDRFPEWDGRLPKVPTGVNICRTDRDLGPATKILPAARDLRGQAAQILFCDDDCIVAPGWANRLFSIQAQRPNEAVAVYVRPAEGYVANPVKAPGRRAWQLPIRYALAYRASRLAHKLFGTPVGRRRPFVVPGYGEVFFGVGGVVVRPDFFDDIAFDIPDVARPVDDVWLSANLARRGIHIYCPWMAALPDASDMASQDALLDAEFLGKKRQELNKAAAQVCQQKFGVWP
ncbi:MAG: glycosyltransferase [Limnohabitans sp.]